MSAQKDVPAGWNFSDNGNGSITVERRGYSCTLWKAGQGGIETLAYEMASMLAAFPAMVPSDDARTAAIGVANVTLVEAGLPGIHVLLAALNSTLWVLEHPDVNALNLCGSPKEQAKHIRALVAEFCPNEERAICDASTVFQAPGGTEP